MDLLVRVAQRIHIDMRGQARDTCSAHPRMEPKGSTPEKTRVLSGTETWMKSQPGIASNLLPAVRWQVCLGSLSMATAEQSQEPQIIAGL